jgi:hypothetical protein
MSDLIQKVGVLKLLKGLEMMTFSKIKYAPSSDRSTHRVLDRENKLSPA